jgi:hypothetical protein
MGLFGSKKESIPALPQVWPEAPNSRLSRLDCVGESHHVQAILDVLGGSPALYGVAVLLPEPQNAHDPSAIAVYVNARRVGYLSKQSAASSRRAIMSVISKHGHTAVEVMILGGRQMAEVVIQPSDLETLSRGRLTYALLGAGFRVKDGEKDWGFTVKEEQSRSLVFCSGATKAQRDELVPKYAEALLGAGFRAQVVLDDGYPMVQVTK